MSRKSQRKTARPPAPSHRPRRPLRTIVSLAGLVVVAVAVVWYLRRDSNAFPEFVRTADQNVLIVTVDTLRADALGSYGGRAATPVLDQLARDGVRFTFAHAHAVVTLPSHSTILTGRYPFQHQVRDNAGFRLPESVETIAEAARATGFATAAFVGAFPVDRQFGLAQGFDVYDDLSGRQVAPSDFAFTERRAAEVVAPARAWIDQQKKPWLVWVHVFDPHSPYEPPAPFNAEYAGNAYAGEVAYTDQALAPLIDAARSSSRPTTVIVTADHGEGLGDHGEPTHGVFAYESTLHVPLILAQYRGSAGRGAGGPGVSGSQGAGGPGGQLGAISDVAVRHVDIVPTIADLTGIPVASDLPGRTLTAAMNGEAEPRPMYFEAMTAMLKRGWAPLRGVLLGREKYIDLPIQEFYDIAADPREERNAAPAAGERVRVMTAQLSAYGDTMPGEQGSENAEVRARLQSLGYLSGAAPRKARYTEADDPKGLIDVDRLMIEGIELHRQGRHADAMAAYRRVIERRPDMNLAYRRLAFIQWEAGATRDAIATLRTARAKNGADVDVDVKLGTYLAETGAVAEAIPMLERATTAQPDNSEAMNALGIAYARARRAPDAERLFSKILSGNPRDGFALENLATVYMERGNLKGAEETFRRAVQNDPRSSRGHAGLGVVALQAGRRDEAIEHWRRAVQLDPRNFDALFNLVTQLASAGRMADARPFAHQFVRTAPPAFYGREIQSFQAILK